MIFVATSFTLLLLSTIFSLCKKKMPFQLFSQIQQHKVRAVKSLLTSIAYLCVGLQSAIIGVAILDLQIMVQSSLESVTFIVTGRCLGHGLGSVFAGFMENKINPQLFLMYSLIISAAAIATMPFYTSIYPLIAAFSTTGFINGIMDNGKQRFLIDKPKHKHFFVVANRYLIELWAKECSPFLQFLQVCFGLGAILTSLLFEPFLKENELGKSTKGVNYTRILLKPDDIELGFPISTVAIITFATGLPFLYMYMRYPTSRDHPSKRADDSNENDTNTEQKMDPEVRTTIIFLSAILFVFYGGHEKMITTFIEEYGHEGVLHLPKWRGALVTAVYWATFTIFPIIVVIFSNIFTPTVLLTFGTVNTIIAAGLLCIFPKREGIFWFSCAHHGVGLSPTWAAMFAFIESKFPLTGKVLSVLVVGAGIGASTVPILVGYLMSYNNAYFRWSSLVLAMITATLFYIIYLITKFGLFNERNQESANTEVKETNGNVFTISHPTLQAADTAV